MGTVEMLDWLKDGGSEESEQNFLRSETHSGRPVTVTPFTKRYKAFEFDLCAVRQLRVDTDRAFHEIVEIVPEVMRPLWRFVTGLAQLLWAVLVFEWKFGMLLIAYLWAVGSAILLICLR
jgi:hypothetical protein